MFRPTHFALGLLSLGLAAFLAWGAVGLAIDHHRTGDFEHWVEQPAVLESLELRPSIGGDSKDYVVDCRYAYEVDGRSYRGTTFGLDRPGFAVAEHGKTYVERELGLVGQVRWRREPRAGGTAWILEPGGLAVTIGRSPRDPSKTTLTGAPPDSASANWAAVTVLGVLALLFVPIGIGLVRPDRRAAG